jgi:glutamate/tyrosine decarboxylase-like PLP-dependent enzyme
MNGSQSGPDAGETAHLTEALQRVLPALEQFVRFDSAGRSPELQAGWKAALQEPLPEVGAGPRAVLDTLAEVVIPNGLRTGAPGFSGWVTTMPTTVPAAAALSGMIAGPARMLLQPFNFLEDLAIEWLKHLLHIPASYQGLFTSGGAIANLVGLGAARQAAYEKVGLDPSRDGLGGLAGLRIYASREAHHVVHRAAGVLGLGRRAVVEVPVNDAFRMDVDALRGQIRRDRGAGCTPVAVVATAGTVNTGAVDPIADLVELCRDEQIWLHVDGAYGLFGVLDPDASPLFAAVSEADSHVVDPHKWLATPVGCGAVFVRDRDLLTRAFTLEPAAYLDEQSDESGTARGRQFQELGHQFHHLGLEQTAPSRGVQVWSILKEAGAQGIRDRIRRHNGFARHLADRVRASPVLELLAPVDLSICCFRYAPPAVHDRADRDDVLDQLNRQVLTTVQARGRCMPSGTRVRGAYAIRACYINPRTTIADVDALVDEVEHCGATVWQKLERRLAEGWPARRATPQPSAQV